MTNTEENPMTTIDARASRHHIDVPAAHVLDMIETILIGDPQLTEQELSAIGHVVASIDRDSVESVTWTLVAHDAWWLSYHANPEDAYGLDETDESTFDYPPVVAKYETHRRLIDEHPDLDDELTAVAIAETDALLGRTTEETR